MDRLFGQDVSCGDQVNASTLGQPILTLPGGAKVYKIGSPHGDAEVVQRETVCQQQQQQQVQDDAEGIENQPSAATEGTQRKVLPRFICLCYRAIHWEHGCNRQAAM